jgi:hypothetical protein
MKFSLKALLLGTIIGFTVQAADYTCRIYSSDGWQACGIAHKGDIVEVKAYGSWKYSSWRAPVGPEGTNYAFGDNLMSDCPHAALIYTMDRRVGWCYARPEDRKFIAPEDGPIFFTINDGGYRGDNSGAIDVYVHVESPNKK